MATGMARGMAKGVITDLAGQGDKAEAVVQFREKGEKRLLLAWAPLKKA